MEVFAMKTSKIKNLILIISIIFIVNIISIGTVNATQKAWDKTEAKTELFVFLKRI